VNSGAVDDLAAIADICAEQDLWLHVDGAYGAFGVLDPEIAHRYAGLDRADSLALDPHKWLGVPVDCGCVLVRDPVELRGTFSLVPSYLRDENAGGLGWFSEYGIEQTRPFRSLKVWATIAASGREGIAADVAHCTATARRLGELVDAEPALELLAPVETSIVAFRYAPAGAPAEVLERVNRALPVAIQERGRTFVTGTVLAGHEAVRACLINPAATEPDIAVLVAEATATGADLLAALSAD
jgi:glutamate/tyrosine decarboxylase-like PLP-dependent enzyme